MVADISISFHYQQKKIQNIIVSRLETILDLLSLNLFICIVLCFGFPIKTCQNQTEQDRGVGQRNCIPRHPFTSCHQHPSQAVVNFVSLSVLTLPRPPCRQGSQSKRAKLKRRARKPCLVSKVTKVQPFALIKGPQPVIAH